MNRLQRWLGSSRSCRFRRHGSCTGYATPRDPAAPATPRAQCLCPCHKGPRLPHFTVIGMWNDDDPYVVGVVAGSHRVEGGWDMHTHFHGPWAELVFAHGVDEAERMAKEKMRDTLAG